MSHAWLAFRLFWSAAIVVYLALFMIPGRVSNWEKKFNGGLFAVVVLFVWIRIFGRYLFHGGLVFQFALVIAGSAAAIGILFRVKALISRVAGNSGERSR